MAVKTINGEKMELNGNITVTLNEDERFLIVEALTEVAPKRVDIVPLMLLMDRMVKGK